MKGDKIPYSHNIARLCLPRTVANGEIQPSAFMLRLDDEFLSVNWLECLNCSSRDDEITEIRRVLNTKLNISARAKIAVLNVGKMCDHVHNESPDQRILSVLHDPSISNTGVKDPSHSGIYNLRQDNELIAEIIIEVIRETYSARS